MGRGGKGVGIVGREWGSGAGRGGKGVGIVGKQIRRNSKEFEGIRRWSKQFEGIRRNSKEQGRTGRAYETPDQRLEGLEGWGALREAERPRLGGGAQQRALLQPLPDALALPPRSRGGPRTT